MEKEWVVMTIINRIYNLLSPNGVLETIKENWRHYLIWPSQKGCEDLLLPTFCRSRHWALGRVSNLVKILQPGLHDSPYCSGIGDFLRKREWLDCFLFWLLQLVSSKGYQESHGFSGNNSSRGCINMLRIPRRDVLLCTEDHGDFHYSLWRSSALLRAFQFLPVTHDPSFPWQRWSPIITHILYIFDNEAGPGNIRYKKGQ